MADDNDLMFDPEKGPFPFPLPIPGPWFPKYPQRASMSFGDFVAALNGSPAESPVWGVVQAVRAAQATPTFVALRGALKANEGVDDALQGAFDGVPAVAAALRAGSNGSDEAALVRLLHPFFLAVDWELVQAP